MSEATKKRGHDEVDKEMPTKVKHSKRNNTKGSGRGGTSKKDTEGGNKAVRIPRDIYNNLTKDQKVELRKTGKLDGYTIAKDPDDKGVHACVKNKPTKGTAPIGVGRITDQSVQAGRLLMGKLHP